MIIFRCDAGPQIGIGHLMRCRALAEAFLESGMRSGLVGPKKKYQTCDDKLLFDFWIPVESWNQTEDDAHLLCNIADQYNALALVIDDYRANKTYQEIIKKRGIKWLQFVHHAELACYPDWAVYANPNAAEDFSEIYKNQKRLFLGPKYAVLRREFWNLEKDDIISKIQSVPFRVLCAFGGGDDRGWVLYTLKEIARIASDDVLVTIISGKHNPRISDIKKYCQNHKNIELLVDPKSVSKVILNSELAIVSGGTFTYEVAACGVPMIIVAISDNQYNSISWQELGVGKYVGELHSLKSGDLALKLKQLIFKQPELFEMQKKLKLLDCGKGAIYIASAMCEELQAL